jgi:hypothetical protein
MRRPGSLLLLFFFAAVARAHDLPSGNLAALGRVWGVGEYAHPWIGYRDVDLDAAVLRAIDRVRTTQQLSPAIAEMLSVLGDEATFVRRPCVETNAPIVDRSARMLAPGIVYLSATAPADLAALRTAKAAVVDLRPQPGRCSAPVLSQDVVPLLVNGNVPRAQLRKVRHHGYRSQDPASTANDFTSDFATIYTGAETGDASVTKVVFIVSDRSKIPPFATALAAAEVATFVSVGRFPLESVLDHCEVGLADGMIVTLRTSELVDAEGYGAEPSPMITFAADASEGDVLAAALQLAKPRTLGRRRAAHPSVALTLPGYEWRRDAAYAESTVPDTAHRILAAYRIWNAIEFLHPNPGAAWHTEFGEIIGTLEQATTRQQYELALAEVVARVPDGQAAASSSSNISPPFRLMPVEEKPVVVESSATGVKPGDELLRMDGHDVSTRIAEVARYACASTSAAKQAAILRDLVSGAPNSQSTFTFRRPDGTTYDVALARTPSAFDDPKPWRVLEGNVAYVDARYLDANEVQTLFDEVRTTRAMILDLRNGARNLGEFVQRMNTTGATIASTTNIPRLVGGAYQSATFDQTIGGSSLPAYAGTVILLIDERTQGAAEELAVMLDTIAAAEIIGTPSAGTSGATTSLVVPGNILVRFTATDVRYADGRAVHGAGVVPNYQVTRTIRGLAEGRDEILDKAIELAR